MYKWLNKESTYEEGRTNWEVIQHAWNNRKYIFYKGQIIPIEEYRSKLEIRELYDDDIK